MDTSLLTFLENTPERAVPYPWERYFDFRLNLILYKNHVTQGVVIDMRSRVNVGGGRFHVSNLWRQITGRSYIEHSRYCIFSRVYDHDHPFVLQPSCCCSPFMHLIVPEPVWFCPLCGRYMVA